MACAIFSNNVEFIQTCIEYYTNHTNNHAEAANRSLNQLMTNRPTIWDLGKEGTGTQYAHLVTVNSPQEKLQKCRDTDNRINKLVDR